MSRLGSFDERHPLVEHGVGLAAEHLDVVAEVDQRLGEVAGVDALAADVGLAPVARGRRSQRPWSAGRHRSTQRRYRSVRPHSVLAAVGVPARSASAGLVQRVARGRGPASTATSSGEIGAGLCALVGVTHTDTPTQARKLAERIWHLRVMDDDDGVMNRSVADTTGAVLVVSQFTLYGDTSRGRRPSWLAAARPEQAEPLVRRGGRRATPASAPRWPPAGSAPRWRSSSSTTARSPSARGVSRRPRCPAG